jgi:hypothetical protein
MAPGCKPGGLTSYVGSNPTPCILSGDDTGAGVGIEPDDSDVTTIIGGVALSQSDGRA